MLSASSFRHLRYVKLCTCRYLQYTSAMWKIQMFQYGTKSSRTKNARDRVCAVCRWQTVLYTWLNLNRRLNFVLCSPIATHLYTWLEQLWAVRIILGHFRHTPDTIDGQPRIARSQISMFWSELNSTKTVGAPPWRSKTVVHRGGKAPIFNFWLVRNSGDGSWIFIWYPVYTLWKYPEWIFWGYSEHGFPSWLHVPICCLIKDHLVSRWYHD